MLQFPYLFSSLTIKNVTFKNRIFTAPCSMTPGDPQHRGPDEKQIMYFEDKARGGAAAVTVAETSVNLKYGTRKFVGNVVLMDPTHDRSSDYVKLAAAIGRHGAVPSIQLFHPGDTTHPKFIEGRSPIGPNTYTRSDGVQIQGMDEALMDETCKDFAAAALLLKNWGFKMIMIHGGHGWLFSQFLSPATNWRTDEYGGLIENRARLPIRILNAVREAVGHDFLIEFRISGDEHMENGITLEDVCAFSQMIEGIVDIIHLSAGSYYTTNQYTFPGILVPGGPQGCNLYLAKAVKKAVQIPVATVGGYWDPHEMDRIIREGDADIIYMARQILADPETPNKIRQGRLDDIVPCTRCMNCLGNFDKKIFGCDVNPNVGHELLDMIVRQSPKSRREVVVVGGGPGGMVTALTAAERGHQVVLIEKENVLGGTLNALDHDCHKKDLMRYRDYLINKIGRSNVDIRLGVEATPEMVNDLTPFALIVAVGSTVIVPDILGLLEYGSFSTKDINDHAQGIGEKIVIIGGGLTGCETGLHFAEIGKTVVVIEMMDEIASEANHMYRPAILETLERLSDNISCIVNTTCVGVVDKGVEVEGPDGRHFIEADTAMYSVGLRARKELVETFATCDVPFFRPIGDCNSVANVRKAVYDGYHAAMDIS